MTLFALIFSIALGIGSLAWGYDQVGLLQFTRWIILFGAVWLFAVWQRWRWFAYMGLVFNFLAAAFGLWFLNFTPGWMFAGAIGGLMAWDLTFFRHRLRFAASDEERRAVETRHLVRISLLAILGFGFASVAMILKLQFNFEWALLSAIVAALGITQIVSWFRRRS
ncbi:MAG: hypothetical protein M1282_14975 [Chloroflexi bacterium]|nr:hypothetical protein [Chloroflexota bacterium]